MSQLPSNIETPLTDQMIEAATKAILSAKTSPNSPSDQFPRLSLSPQTPPHLLKLFNDLEAYYIDRDYHKLQSQLASLAKEQFSKPKEFAVRKLFTQCMMTVSGLRLTEYESMTKLIRINVTNGDVYLGLAALKLSRYKITDCTALLELTKLCPIYHPIQFQIIVNKLAWIIKISEKEIYDISIRFKVPKFAENMKITHPESVSKVDELMKRFQQASHLDRYHVVYSLHQPENKFILSDPHIDYSALRGESALLTLPDTAFNLILSHLDFSNIKSLSTTCVIASQRVRSSPDAYRRESSEVLGIPLSSCSESQFNPLSLPNLMRHLRLIRKLQQAHAWDVNSFSDFLCDEGLGSSFKFKLWVGIPASICGLDRFLRSLHSLVKADREGYGIQFLVSKTNLHFLLARLIRTIDLRYGSEIVGSILSEILASKAQDSMLWTEQLLDAGFQNLLLIMENRDNPKSALGLRTFILYHHFIKRSAVERNFAQLASNFANTYYRSVENVSKTVEEAGKLVSGVWHVVWYSHMDWPHLSLAPQYACIRVRPTDLRLESDSPTGLYKDSEVDQEAIYFNSECICLSPVSVLEKGIARLSLTFKGKGSVGLDFSIPTTDFAFVGESLCFGFGGCYLEVNSLSQPFPQPKGSFIAWKSNATDIDSYWSECRTEMRDLQILRTSGLEYQRHKKLLTSLPAALRDTSPKDLIQMRYWSIVYAANLGSLPITVSRANLEIVLGNRSVSEITTDTPILLPAIEFEREEMAEMRRATTAETQVFAMEHWIHTAARFTHPGQFGDLIIIITRLEEIYATLLDIKARVQGDAHVSAMERQLLDTYKPGAIEQLAEQVTSIKLRLQTHLEVARTFPDEATTRLLSDFRSILLNTYGTDIPLAIWTLPAPEMLASMTDLMKFQYGDDIHPISAPNIDPSSSLTKRIIQRYEYEDSLLPVKQVYRRWEYHFFAANPSIDPFVPAMSLEMLFLRVCACFDIASRMEDLSNAILPDFGPSDELELPSAPIIPTFSKSKKRSTGATIATISLIGLGVMAIGLGAFALGRIFNRKSSN